MATPVTAPTAHDTLAESGRSCRRVQSGIQRSRNDEEEPIITVVEVKVCT
jgi:hypothetical protein